MEGIFCLWRGFGVLMLLELLRVNRLCGLILLKCAGGDLAVQKNVSIFDTDVKHLSQMCETNFKSLSYMNEEQTMEMEYIRLSDYLDRISKNLVINS